MTIREEFLFSINKYLLDKKECLNIWNDVERHYNAKNRYYHNMLHLENLSNELIAYKSNFKSWDTVVFAIVFHDVIYNVLKNDNEEKSANYALKKLLQTSFDENLREFSVQLILATKTHAFGDFETNLFTDADLSILGANRKTYFEYAKKIRREYAIYPDIVYNPGRKKVLHHFLKMDKIFKTSHFSSLYESNARSNMEAELNALADGTL